MIKPREERLVMHEQRKWFLETEASPGDDAAKTVGMTMKDSEYYINLVDQAAAGSERMDPNSERSSTVGKRLTNGMTCCREIVRERKSQPMQQTSLLSCFKKWPQPAPPSATTVLTSRQPSTWKQDPLPAKILLLAKSSDEPCILSSRANYIPPS